MVLEFGGLSTGGGFGGLVVVHGLGFGRCRVALRVYIGFRARAECHGVRLDTGSSRSGVFPDPREDPKSRSLNGGSYKVPLVV